MNFTLLSQQLLNGLAVGGVYALFALGYTLVFSILRVINFTHGALFALGAYFTYALTGSAFGFNGLLRQPAPSPLACPSPWPCCSAGSWPGSSAWAWSASPLSRCASAAPTRC